MWHERKEGGIFDETEAHQRKPCPALGLSLAACGSKPAPSGAETPAGELGTLSGPVELQFWHSISNQNHLKVLEGLVEEFNETIGAEKGITVVPTFNGSSSELYSSVVGAIKAGAPLM